MGRKRALNLKNEDIKRAKRDLKIARDSESTKPNCHNALPRTEEGWFPNKPGKLS